MTSSFTGMLLAAALGLGAIRAGPGRIEAIAVVGGDCEIEARTMGIPYVCAPGEMQSPPLDWRHGGGEFIDMMVGSR